MSARRLWLAVAAAWLAGSGAGAAAGDSWLTSIGHNLRAELAGVLEMAAVNYSAPDINASYVARLQFDMRAMGALYNSTPLVLDAIFHKQAYPEGIVSVSDGHVEVHSPLSDKWRPLVAHYAGPLAALLAAALLAAALPLAGLFWCCCYWCRGGQRRRPFDRKYDACIKGLLAILLIALLTLFLFGVVCAFASDSQVEEGAAGAPAAVRGGARDVRTFLNASAAHAHHLLVTNYDELERKLNAMLTSSGLTISVQLGEFSRAVSVTTLAGMVRQLDAVHADLQSVAQYTRSLRAQAEQLNAELRLVKGQLLQTLAQCEQPQCRQLQEKHRIGQLDTEIQYSQMPDVTELLNNVTALLQSDIKQEVEEGARVFRQIQRGVQRSVDEHIPGVQRALADTGKRLAGVAAEITWQAGNASAGVARAQTAATDGMRAALARYGPYRRAAGLAAAGALLAVVVVLAWGLTCGVCGKRPDVYGASECCNKGAGSKCLLCGTFLMFLVGGCVALVLLAYLAAGGLAARAVCDPLTEPEGNRLFSDLEHVVQLERALFNERTDPNFNMSAVLRRCHRNHTLYQVLDLHRLYDVSALRAEAAADVRRRAAALRPAAAWSSPVRILSEPARAKLRRLAAAGLSDFHFERILAALETNMTTLSLEELSEKLEAAARALEQRPGFGAVAGSLRAAAARLQRAAAAVLRPMLRDTAALNETASRLRDGLRFNHSSLKEAVSYLMHETAQAETFLNTQGPDLIQNMTREFAEVVAGLLDQYLERVEHGAKHEVGRCGPLSQAYNATRDAHCRKLLMPWNGYWIALAWCLALLVPLMITAQRLARLYLHLDPYPGPLVEAEYLYDAYADRDNVPLANAYKAEKRAGRGEARRSAGGAAGGGGGAAGGGGGAPAAGGAAGERARADLAPPLDAHHARRYNDMAPKHWEEGPPRYHGPTEYERPPPYYYPGPADRQ